jgi:hypothetical protein
LRGGSGLGVVAITPQDPAKEDGDLDDSEPDAWQVHILPLAASYKAL